MTYFQFLAIFLGIPLLALSGLTWWDARRGRRLPAALHNVPAWLSIALHVVVAVLYTTPWDNYLVATGVWYYNPRLVTGITLGWVPIEEYTFFVVQTIVTGLWLLSLIRWLPLPPASDAPGKRLRLGFTLALAVPWLGSIALLASGWAPGTYLGLILVWALPPVMLQTAFGGDLLWRYRRIVALGILVPTLYLGAADSLAIGAGTWTIAPDQSLEWFVAGVLPLEELIFFLMTNTLIVFGMTLFLACESRVRARNLMERLPWLHHHENACEDARPVRQSPSMERT